MKSLWHLLMIALLAILLIIVLSIAYNVRSQRASSQA